MSPYILKSYFYPSDKPILQHQHRFSLFAAMYFIASWTTALLLQLSRYVYNPDKILDVIIYLFVS